MHFFSLSLSEDIKPTNEFYYIEHQLFSLFHEILQIIYFKFLGLNLREDGRCVFTVDMELLERLFKFLFTFAI